MHTQFLGWGCGFFDFDNDGWTDILICNGDVHPEVEQLRTEAGYAQRKLLYRNQRNGHFEDVSLPRIILPLSPNGCSSPADRAIIIGDACVHAHAWKPN